MGKKIILFLTFAIVLVFIARPFWLPVLVIPNLLPQNNFRPLENFTKTPGQEDVVIEYITGSLSADLYLPAGEIKKTTLMVHGVNETGKDDERIANFGRTLARAGVAVLIPTFPDLLRSSFRVDSVEQIKAAISWLNEKYPQPMNLISFSVAGAPSFIAASDLGQEFDVIITFGSHYDLRNALKYVTTGTHEFRGEIFNYPPDEFGKQLIASQYRQILGSNSAVENILANSDAGNFDKLYEELPEEFRIYLSGLSLPDNLGTLHSRHIIIAHSNPDNIIPHTEAMRLQQALPDSELVFLRAFSHVTAEFPSFTPKSIFNFYIPEAWKMYRIVYKTIND